MCEGKQCRTDVLDRGVWDDACALLADPDRVRREYEVLRSRKRAKGTWASDQVGKLIAQVKRGIARLIDAYEEGLLDKAGFEPRVREAKARLTKLQGEAESAAKRESEDAELAAAIGQLEGFAGRVRSGLQSADWNARREILRALVKRVEVGTDAVKVVYKVDPRPFEQGPGRGSSQHCGRGDGPALRRAIGGGEEVTPVHDTAPEPGSDLSPPRGSWPVRPVGGEKRTPALTVPQLAGVIGVLLRRGWGCDQPERVCRNATRRLVRNELARFYHWRRRKRLAPRRIDQRR